MLAWCTVALTDFSSSSLPAKVHLSNSQSDTVEFFFDCGFFPGCTFAGKLQVPTSTIQFLWWGLPIQAFLGPGWGEVLILSVFISEYLHVHLQKKHTSEHPLPDLRPDLES